MGQGSKGAQTGTKRSWLLVFPLVLLLLVASLFLAAKVDHESQFLPKQPESSTDSVSNLKRVRQPAVAGAWYPSDRVELQTMVDALLSRCKHKGIEGRVKALVIPHAGWRYSGQTAASAFYQLGRSSNSNYDQVVVLAPSHYTRFRGVSLPNVTHYKTPLGLVETSSSLQDLINLDSDLFQSLPRAHNQEHAIEAELPFLQSQLDNFTLLPLVVGSDTREKELVKIASILKKHTGENTLWIVSADFTHYGPRYGFLPFSDNRREKIRQLDFGAIDKIKTRDIAGFMNHTRQRARTIDGKNLVPILLQVLKEEPLNITVLDYQTSGNLTGSYTNSVSYVAMAMTQPPTSGSEEDQQTMSDDQSETEAQFSLPQSEQDYLLDLARKAIKRHLETGDKPEVDETEVPDSLKEVKGCFVTLNKNGNLRGCIGHIEPQEKLYKCMIDNAINAAVNDRRFSSVTSSELEQLDIEISVLTVPQELEFSSGEELKQKLRKKVDGVILKRGFHQSTYLPQVWEQMPDKEQFLTRLCRKGGMNGDCWQNTNTKVLTYQAFVFSE